MAVELGWAELCLAFRATKKAVQFAEDDELKCKQSFARRRAPDLLLEKLILLSAIFEASQVAFWGWDNEEFN